MPLRYLLSILAGIGLVLGIIAVIISSKSPPTPPIPYPPPQPPFEHFIASVGLIESASENIAIGSPFSEIVEEVYVDSGDLVLRDDPLFRLNTASLEAQRMEAVAAYEVALANYERQLDLPRPETIPAQKARVTQSVAGYLDALAQYELVQHLENPKAVSRDEYNQRKFGALAAQYQLEEEQDNLSLLLAGAWVRDIAIYRAEKKRAEAAVKVIEENIRRSIIRAPFSGIVLQVNVHGGEFASSMVDPSAPLVLFGSINLELVVDIDEEQIWRFIPDAPAIAYVRGNSSLSIPLEFKCVRPFLVPKQTLSGGSLEFVDTRVLQVLYFLDKGDMPIYPGELMDVYIQAKPSEVQ